MTERLTLTRRIAIGAIAFATFASMGVLPAAAALTDEEALYGGYLDFDGDGPPVVQGFGIVSDTTAVITPLPQTLPSIDINLNGIEIVDGIGYAVGRDANGLSAVFRWDVATGALINTFEVTSSLGEVDSVYTLTATENDAELPDGTLITIVEIGFDEAPDEVWVGSVDPATGVFTALVDITALDEAEGQFYADSMASDPTTGFTYILSDTDIGDPSLILLDLTGGTYVGPNLLTGIDSSLNIAYIVGADFDSDGILWFNYESNIDGLAHTDGPLSLVVTATSVGPLSDAGEGGGREQLTDLLAIGPAPVPQLAATGAPVAQLLLAGAALLATGAMVLVGSRRKVGALNPA